MTVLAILLGSVTVLALGGRFYGSRIARVFGEDADNPTPAVRLEDGLDYVPTRTPVVFAHHFASIAGAGPIVGPIIGVAFGWAPAVLWIVCGAIFAGAVHDYGAMFVSVRERGHSIAVIARQTLGKTAFLLFVFLLIVLMVLVTAMFLILSANALTSKAPAEMLGLSPDQNLVYVDQAGAAHIGGIATMSVLVITALAPAMGWLYLKRKAPVWLCSLLALVVCGCSIAFGLYFPLRIPSVPFLESFGFAPEQTAQVFWMLCLSVYCLLAAGLPVWIFLQSRDFINVHILYIGIAGLLMGLIGAGLAGSPNQFPAFRGWTVDVNIGGTLTAMFFWPFLFITIACGACSGFHSLCASGTTAKQLESEPAVRRVGFYGMLLEGFLAVCVVCACLVGLSGAEYRGIMLETDRANPVLAFAVAVGHTMNQGLGMPVAAGAVFAMLLLEGFLVTTLDTAIRLSRYLLEEAWGTIFERYDVFAERRRAEDTATAGACCGLEQPDLEPAGADGIDTHPDMPIPEDGQTIRTTGAFRLALRIVGHYWFNTALIVVLMLWMATTGHVLALWALFGAGNQLLAGLALTVVSTWLISKGRNSAYTAIPAVFMLVTTLTMLGRLLVTYLSTYLSNPTAPEAIKILPLLVFDVLVLVLTIGILARVAIRWTQGGLGTKRLEPAATG